MMLYLTTDDTSAPTVQNLGPELTYMGKKPRRKTMRACLT
jgi:hypothetical protein